MTTPSCEETRDMLVDYADGELLAQDAQAVAAHLAECPACQEIAKGLERSLQLAQAIWHDNLEAVETLSVRRPVIRLLSRIVIAATILLTAGVFVFHPFHGSAEQEHAEIERQVASVATAARLLAATQLLAQCEGTESLVEAQRRYILDNYADTPAAATLKNSNPFRRNSQ